MKLPQGKLLVVCAGALLGVSLGGCSLAHPLCNPYRQKIKLISLQCLRTEDQCVDEAYIKINDTRVWGPKNMRVGETRCLDVTVGFEGTAVISLWDEDGGLFDPDDCLGSVAVSTAHVGGQYEVCFTE